MSEPEPLMPHEAARRLGVNAKTLTRWSREGRVPSIRTLGGHRRYDPDTIAKVMVEGLETRNTKPEPSRLRARMEALTRLMVDEGQMTPYGASKVLSVLDTEAS